MAGCEDTVARSPDIGKLPARVGATHRREHIAGNDGLHFINCSVMARRLLGYEETHAADDYFVPVTPPFGEPQIEVGRVAGLFEHEEVPLAPRLWNFGYPSAPRAFASKYGVS